MCFLFPLLTLNFHYSEWVPAVMATFSKGGAERQKAALEARENIKTLEGGLGRKHYFGGQKWLR